MAAYVWRAHTLFFFDQMIYKSEIIGARLTQMKLREAHIGTQLLLVSLTLNLRLNLFVVLRVLYELFFASMFAKVTCAGKMYKCESFCEEKLQKELKFKKTMHAHSDTTKRPSCIKNVIQLAKKKNCTLLLYS